MQSLAEKLSKGKEGLKQFSRRAQEKVLQKLGAHSGTNDPAFDIRLTRIQKMDEQLQTVHDAVEDYLAASAAAQRAAVNLGRAFEEVLLEDEAAGGGSAMKGILGDYVERNKKIQSWMKDVIEATCTETVPPGPAASTALRKRFVTTCCNPRALATA